jgi:hypothetical protein
MVMPPPSGAQMGLSTPRKWGQEGFAGVKPKAMKHFLGPIVVLAAGPGNRFNRLKK